mgnify:CR=1 FL=1
MYKNIVQKNINKFWAVIFNSDQIWISIWMKKHEIQFWINSNTYLVREFGGGIQRVAIWIYYKFAFLRTQNCISCSTSKYLFVHFLYYINFCNIKEEEWARERGGRPFSQKDRPPLNDFHAFNEVKDCAGIHK